MSFNEYKSKVVKMFKSCGYSDADTSKYFSTKQVDELLRKHYEGFTDNGIAGYSPEATASCLDMLYE